MCNTFQSFEAFKVTNRFLIPIVPILGNFLRLLEYHNLKNLKLKRYEQKQVKSLNVE